ncbi:MAG: ProQ/FinO family protein [Gammaproteobacteria bacterium]|nr:ProQ/FinO family protein [Gammaproteobacteria bacterium]
MNNLTLKEQLQALSLGSSSTPQNVAERSKTKPKKHGESKPATKQKPAWLEHAQYGVELLKAYFPLCFKEIKDIQPLKIGIKQDLVKRLATMDNIVLGDKACMVSSLAYYVSSPAYHKNAVEGAARVDLDGNAAGFVSVEEAQYSTECRKAKLQKAKPSNRAHANSIPKTEAVS